MTAPGPAVEGVRGVLLKLRTHAGLTVPRLAVTDVNVTLLAGLPSVRDLVVGGTPAGEAIVSVVRTLVGQLGPSDLLIADAALALGVVRDRVGARPAVAGLTAPDLGARRKALAGNWEELHALLDAEAPRRPTVRSLRGAVEYRTLGVLAALCVASPARRQPTAAQPPDDEPPDDTGIVVVGGAVMDRIFMVNDFAAPNGSAEAVTYDAHPGGKGLNLTMAAARMGLAPRLITAIGDDHDADRMVAYMRERRLPTRYVKVTRGAATPVTAVIVAADGRSTNYGWRNVDDVKHTDDELRELEPVVAGADAVIVTFEPALTEVEWALRTVASSTPKPLLVVQSSPRLESPQLLYQYLPYVDYLVGTEQDLRDLLGPAGEHDSFNEIAGRLFNAGAKAICAVDNLMCRVRATGMFENVRAPEGLMTEAPAARERFAVALVHQLLNYGPELTKDKLQWAAAAMAPQDRPDVITDAMPEPSDVDERLHATTAWRN